MSSFETRTSQFGLVSAIQQYVSDLITIVEPESLFSPEARKGRMYIVVESDQDLAGSLKACQQAARTIRKTFYEDTSFSVTSALRAAVRAANQALYQHNFNVPDHQRTYVGLTCAVIRGRNLFLAQVSPSQAYILSEGHVRALPTHPSWQVAHVSAAPFLQPGALGMSLFVEPELYRSPLHNGDMLVMCSSNLAQFLHRDVIEEVVYTEDPDAATECLLTLCQQNNLVEAHALVVEIVPALSLAARRAPLSQEGLRERSQWMLRAIKAWAVRLSGDVVLMTRKRRQRERSAGTRHQPSDDLTTMPDLPDHSPSLPPKPRPIDLGASLQEREFPDPNIPRRRKPSVAATVEDDDTLPPSTFLGEDAYDDISTTQERIDLSSPEVLARYAQPYRPRYEQRPWEAMTWFERAMLPFQRFNTAASDWLKPRLRRRPAAKPIPIMRSNDLSYRRQRPPFPWILLTIITLLVTLLILYGLNLSQRTVQQQAINYLDQADQLLAAVREASDDASALERLEVARQAIDEVRASPMVTVTNAALWLRYQELQREYERALAAVQYVTFFEDSTVLAEHPLPGGRFASLIVPGPTTVTTDTSALDALRYVYAIDGDRNTSRLYRIPREGGQPEPILRPGQAVQNTIVGPIQAQAWRVDNIIAIDQSSAGFGYYFRSGNDWNYTRLGGSEAWVIRDRLDLETYEGNLYVWGAEMREVLKYPSGRYGDPPEFWFNPAGLGGRDVGSAVDMAVDGNIYLLLPNGTVLVFSQGSFVREIAPGEITPSISAVTRFFVTGEPDSGWIFLVDTLNERIIQIDKASGDVLQQMYVRADSDIRLDQLSGLFVDESGARSQLYLVNGGQIVQANLPALPKPFSNLAPTATTTP